MSMQYDVKSEHTEISGTTMVSGRVRLKGYQAVSGGTAGDVIFRDGGASGTIRFRFNISTNLVSFGMPIPGEGILFEYNIHVTLPATAKVTIFYG